MLLLNLLIRTEFLFFTFIIQPYWGDLNESLRNEISLKIFSGKDFFNLVANLRKSKVLFYGAGFCLPSLFFQQKQKNIL